MKKIFSIALLQIACLSLFGFERLAPGSSASLFEHLTEVNREWFHVSPDEFLLQNVGFQNDRQRIQTHLRLVEQSLRQRETSFFSKKQLEKRLHHLNVLRRYWQVGTFPTNHFHPHRQPYFVDNFEVKCAVGHLIWQDGGQVLVENIRRENNFGYLPDLANIYPEIGAWATENGFTLDELAWIQPTYSPPPRPNYSAWGKGLGINSGDNVNVMIHDKTTDLLVVGGRFSTLDGFACNNIVGWDGDKWVKLGSGLNGEVFDLVQTYTGLVAVGEFNIPDQPDKQNVAIWDNGAWYGLQTGEMGGAVYSACLIGVRLYFGGQFEKFNGKPVSNLAAGQLDLLGKLTPLELPVLSVNGGLSFVENINDRLLVGGNFTETSILDPNGKHLIVNGLAYFDYADWIHSAADDFNVSLPVSATGYHGNLLVGHLYSELNNSVLSVLNAGIWSDAGASGLLGPRGFFEWNGQLCAYGDLGGGMFHVGNGLVFIDTEGKVSNGITHTDGWIQAAAVYKNYVYLAGGFYTLHNDEFPGLARFDRLFSNIEQPTEATSIHAYFAENQLRISSIGIADEAFCRVFDATGRIVREARIDLNLGDAALDLSQLNGGVYFFEIKAKNGRTTGKFAAGNF